MKKNKKVYIASFRNIKNISKQNPHSLVGSLTISMDNAVTTGNKLKSIIYKTNKSFSHCYFMLCDTLNRHTLMINNPNLEESEAQIIAFNQGNEWLKLNNHLFNELSIPFNIIRWDYWLNHKNYSKKMNIIISEFNNNKSYRKAFYENTKIYLNRKYVNIIEEKQLINCIRYLQEECAVMLLWAEAGYNCELYPAERNLAMSKTYEIFIKPFTNENILVPIKIDVKTRKLSNAQR